jgi:hypothetical protein
MNSGFPGLTNITVTVTNTAFAAATGKTLFASYSMTFKTALSLPQSNLPAR